MAFVEFVLLPASHLRGNREFRVDRERDGLEPLVYTTIAQMHDDYRNDVVCLIIHYPEYVINANQLHSYHLKS